MSSVDGKAQPRKLPDLSRIRKPADVTDDTNTTQPLLQVKVGRPPRDSFIRVRDDPDYQRTVMLYLDKGEGSSPHYYLVDSGVGNVLDDELKPVTLYLTYIRFRGPMIWPVPFPDADETRLNPWIASQRDAAEKAKQGWIRMASDRKVGHYKVWEAQHGIADPDWPNHTFDEIVQVAFQDSVIDSMEHQIVKNLLGLA